MNEIERILREIDNEGNIQEIRFAIANLIIDLLNKASNSLGYWEKAHLANAIAALGWNINSTHQPTTSWLRLCLVNAEKVLVPTDQRDQYYTPIDNQLDSLTFDQLMKAITEVGQAYQ